MTPQCPQLPRRAIPKAWKTTRIPRCRSSRAFLLLDSPGGKFPVGLAGSHPGDTLVLPSPWGCWRDPKSSLMLQLGLLCLGARFCSSSATWWVAVPLQSQGLQAGTPLQLNCWTRTRTRLLPSIIRRQRGTRQPSGHSPSLLLVTGMLWTVRSLKQDPVSTCSSTELRTKAWRSAGGHERSFRGMQPAPIMGTREQQTVILQDLLGWPGAPKGRQQPQTYLFSAVSEWPPSTRTSRSRMTAGRGSSRRKRTMLQAVHRQG